MKKFIIDFDLKQDTGAAFFALYAGLRIYKEIKDAQPKPKDAISVPAAEAYCMLEDLKEKYPTEYEAAQKEYDEIYTYKVRQDNAETIYINDVQHSYGIFCFNSGGDLFLNSDWGSYSYAWRAYGDDFRKFLAGTNADYIVGKFETNYLEVTGKKMPKHRKENVTVLVTNFISVLQNKR